MVGFQINFSQVQISTKDNFERFTLQKSKPKHLQINVWLCLSAQLVIMIILLLLRIYRRDSDLGFYVQIAHRKYHCHLGFEMYNDLIMSMENNILLCRRTFKIVKIIVFIINYSFQVTRCWLRLKCKGQKKASKLQREVERYQWDFTRWWKDNNLKLWNRSLEQRSAAARDCQHKTLRLSFPWYFTCSCKNWSDYLTTQFVVQNSSGEKQFEGTVTITL